MLWCYFVSQGLSVRINEKLVTTISRKIKMSSVNIMDMRAKYKDRTEAFTEDQLVSNDPIAQFTAWFNEVKKCPDIIEPNAMCLATSNKNGEPSSRMVLLKSYGPKGFTFFTNYGSRKGCELEENPNAALLFYWPPFNRQVRIEGKVSKVPEEESIEYFNKRPLASRASAAVSFQSQPCPSKEELIRASNELINRGTVERPSFWGGYNIEHRSVEFWQGQTDRLHDRLVYHKKDDNWAITRLAP